MALASLVLASCSSNEETTTEKSAVVGTRQSGYVADEAGRTGTSNGYFWSLYNEGGTANITQGNGGNFSISYSGCADIVGGKGWNPGSARNIGYNIGSTTGSFDFIGIYGWTTNPLIEYYVCESGNNINGNVTVNTMSSDGHNYTFVKNTRYNAPSIIGTATFTQYIDKWGGATNGTNRNVNMANHINNWRSRGGSGYGTNNYQVFAIEAFNYKTGSINATVW